MTSPRFRLSRYLPFLEWGRTYNLGTLSSDLVAAIIVTMMLVPQSLAYALLAGLPPEIGIYASILPLIAYALFGTSRTLAVGPVALLALMTAAAASRVAEPGSALYIEASIVLALLSGLILFAMGLFRLGFLANFLSHPVVSGFVTASGILIAASQLRHILGVPAEGHTLIEILQSLIPKVMSANLPTLLIGAGSLIFLFWARTGVKPLLKRLGVGETLSGILSRMAPALVIVTGIAVVSLFQLEAAGVRVVGVIPGGLPQLGIPAIDRALWSELFIAALLISIVGFVESISIAQTLAARRKERIEPDQELIGLGAASLASGLSGGFPVTGGLARSAVNFDAGAQTPATGLFTALGLALAALYLTPFLHDLPQAVLAATIIVAVVSLIDLKSITRTWKYAKGDFMAMAVTIIVTLVEGVELGISTGVALSLLLHLYNTSRPHFAFVGQVPGTEHFRNVNRHAVSVPPHILTIRVDESLYFANARFLEDTVYDVIAARPDLKHLILMCPAVNRIDASALESLEAINQRLKEADIQLHLSEVKGPVMDRLRRSSFLEDLTGQVFLQQYQAIKALDPEHAERAMYSLAELTDPTGEPCPSVDLAGVRRLGQGSLD